MVLHWSAELTWRGAPLAATSGWVWKAPGDLLTASALIDGQPARVSSPRFYPRSPLPGFAPAVPRPHNLTRHSNPTHPSRPGSPCHQSPEAIKKSLLACPPGTPVGSTIYPPGNICVSVQFSRVQLFATPWTAARKASLYITSSRSLFKLMSIESVMPSDHLIFCRPFLLPPSIFPSITVFSNESVLIRWPKDWSFSFSISPSNGNT